MDLGLFNRRECRLSKGRQIFFDGIDVRVSTLIRESGSRYICEIHDPFIPSTGNSHINILQPLLDQMGISYPTTRDIHRDRDVDTTNIPRCHGGCR